MNGMNGTIWHFFLERTEVRVFFTEQDGWEAGKFCMTLEECLPAGYVNCFNSSYGSIFWVNC